MTKLALQKGDIVVATARKPEVLDDLKAEYPSSQLITLELDVSNPQHVKDAFKQAKASFGRVDVVFSNAGYGVLGEVEATPEDEARAMFDTNFWGAATVAREAIRFFREENTPSGGHLINVTSQAGVHAWPGLGYYAASKHGKPVTTLFFIESIATLSSYSLRGLDGLIRCRTGSRLEHQSQN